MDNKRIPATTSKTAGAHTTDSRLAAFYKLYNTLGPETAGTQKLRRCLAEVYHPDLDYGRAAAPPASRPSSRESCRRRGGPS